MAIHFGWKGTIVPGPTIEIQCPRCGHAGKADSYEQTDCLRVYFITVLTIRNTFVRCGHCERAILCDAELGQLASMHADAIASAISFRMSSLGGYSRSFRCLRSPSRSWGRPPASVRTCWHTGLPAVGGWQPRSA